MKFYIYIIALLNIIHAQIALPSFHGAHKPHTSVSSSGSQTFSYTGSQQTFTVPSGVTTITIKMWGAQGGSGGYYSYSSNCGTGGKGGYSTGNLSVTAGSTVYVYVGGKGESHSSCAEKMRTNNPLQGGWNGGGDGDYSYSGGGGGGASDIRYNGTSIGDRVIVAGGGGGHGNAGSSTQLSNGGAGGGLVAETKANNTQYGNRTPGAGATQSSGNSNGVGSTGTENLTGGGGGGYYGGGAGANSTGGGGGSGYIGGVSSGSTITGNASMPDPDGGTMTGRDDNGLVVISW